MTTPQVSESLATKVNRDQLVSELRRHDSPGSPHSQAYVERGVLHRAADYIESIEHLQNEVERLRTGLERIEALDWRGNEVLQSPLYARQALKGESE